MVRLGVNIDHIATLRNARGDNFPSVIEAALVCETNGADLITVHLREDRRHIRDEDVIMLRQAIKTELNLEMAATSEMVEFACMVKPDYVCLVPERRQELTTEGGLNATGNFNNLSKIVNTLQQNGILVSLFVDANTEQITAARDMNAYAIEIHTGKYANSQGEYAKTQEFYQIVDMCEFADSLELVVNAGHGLNYHNVAQIAQIEQMHELNIGYAIIANSIFWGLDKAVCKMKDLMIKARI